VCENKENVDKLPDEKPDFFLNDRPLYKIRGIWEANGPCERILVLPNIETPRAVLKKKKRKNRCCSGDLRSPLLESTISAIGDRRYNFQGDFFLASEASLLPLAPTVICYRQIREACGRGKAQAKKTQD